MELGAHNYKNVQVLVSKNYVMSQISLGLAAIFQFYARGGLGLLPDQLHLFVRLLPLLLLLLRHHLLLLLLLSPQSQLVLSDGLLQKISTLKYKNVFCFVHHSAALIEWTAATTARR